jgi:ABC-type arginine transport system ATPase subunit
MNKDTTLTINKRTFEFEDVSKNKKILRELEESKDKITMVISQYAIDYAEFKDKLILSKMTVRQLKNLIKRCEEVISEKISEVEDDNAQLY